MRRSSLLATVVLALAPRGAHAQGEEPGLLSTIIQREPERPCDPHRGAYFDGLGADCTTWELRSDTAFSTNETLTQRIAVGYLHPIHDSELGLVVRTDFGAADATDSGFYSLQGPLFSGGLRLRSPTNRDWVEFGVRVIPNWPGPHDGDPRLLGLALNAVLSSGQADDARWLSFSRWGFQVYAEAQSRAVAVETRDWDVLVGTHYGARSSLPPLSVRTWLGPQQGIVANAFLEFFTDLQRLSGADANIQIGLRGEASLSSIWPGNDVFPAIGSVYAAWAPAPWVSARVFYGIAALVQNGLPASYPTGLSVSFFLP